MGDTTVAHRVAQGPGDVLLAPDVLEALRAVAPVERLVGDRFFAHDGGVVGHLATLRQGTDGHRRGRGPPPRRHVAGPARLMSRAAQEPGATVRRSAAHHAFR